MMLWQRRIDKVGPNEKVRLTKTESVKTGLHQPCLYCNIPTWWSWFDHGLAMYPRGGRVFHLGMWLHLLSMLRKTWSKIINVCNICVKLVNVLGGCVVLVMSFSCCMSCCSVGSCWWNPSHSKRRASAQGSITDVRLGWAAVVINHGL